MICLISLLCRGTGLVFRFYLIGRIGDEGIGLYQLILSVYSLFASFATAGFTVSVSKMCAEAEAVGKSMASVLKKSVSVAVLFGISSGGLLLLTCIPVSNVFICVPGSYVSLAILSVSMPFMSVASCINGYFLASKKVLIPSVCQLFEEIMKIVIAVGTVTVFCKSTTSLSVICASLTVGLTIGEISSFLFLIVALSRSKEKKNNEKIPFSFVSSVMIPNAASVWLTSLLHTFESLIIPYCFTLYGSKRMEANGKYGVIRGMVIPLLFFPFALLSSVINILIPEVSRLSGGENIRERDEKIKKTLDLTFVFSFLIGGVFFFYPSEISNFFYGTDGYSFAFRVLALVTPFMYIETISDGILKGIGEQKYLFYSTVINCVLRIVCVFTLIPFTGDVGYLWLLVLSNVLSFLLCHFRIKKVTSVKINTFGKIIIPAINVTVSGAVSRFLISFIKDGKIKTVFSVLLMTLIYLLQSKAVECIAKRIGNK